MPSIPNTITNISFRILDTKKIQLQHCRCSTLQILEVSRV
ncbi:hypothetical protein ES332_D12G111100v1 [Gossypium tomentosum]|uniref:Uncharacterized protein n=1 Tax=Gossypium tomentosum TaxID=34277 RepID=A0A5D2I790_GOSTO|nr:hypothetical protein ES332_D12G111100v1 [Gossypium tomentosum]